MTPTHRRQNASPVILLLWGTGGDEAAAIVFISELRGAGLAVKLVGLGGATIKGNAGVSLVPDLTLSDALPLASRIAYLIFPFRNHALKRFTTDPRLQDFIANAHTHGAVFVQSESVANAASLAALFPPLSLTLPLTQTPYKLIHYPDGAALYQFLSQQDWSTTHGDLGDIGGVGS